MAYQVSNDSIVQAIMRGRYANQETMNVVHFRPIDPPVGDIADGLQNLQEIAAIVDIAAGGWSTLLAECTNENFTIDWLQLQYVWPTRFSYARFPAEVTAGVRVGDGAPPNVSSVITYQGDAIGRHERGNQHIGGLSAADVTDGRISLSLADDMRTLGEFLITQFAPPTTTIDYEMVIFNRAAPGASVPVTHLTVQSTSRVERRRTVGLGS